METATLKNAFQDALEKHDKKTCITLIKEALENDHIEIPTLYEDILVKSLHDIAHNNKTQEISIWEEHVQSGIVRTIIEMAYPYILHSQEFGESALVFCQEEEYHELGARMTSDYLTLLGFEVTFIGANTPEKQALAAIEALSPKIVCISVTNYYHLSKLEDLIKKIRLLSQAKIIVGGYAIFNTPQAKKLIHPDYFANTFEDLRHIKEAIL